MDSKGYTAQSACGDCAVRFFVRLNKRHAWLLKVSLLRGISVTAYMRASYTLRTVTCAASCSGARLWKPS